MKHALIILSLIVISLSLGNNSSEVRDRAFVQSIEIKQDKNTIFADIKTFNNQDDYVGIGDDIQSCLDNAELKQGKDLFTGHTELLIFQQDSFSFDILEVLVKERLISPNCPVILSSIEVNDFQNVLEILKSYDKQSKLDILSVSSAIKNLRVDNSTEIPILNDDLSFSVTKLDLF